MAIVKDTKTGKYKIVKSPPSFYRSRPKGGSRSSAGSGGVTLSPGQNLAVKEGRNPNLTPSQQLAAQQGRIVDSSGKTSSSYSRRAIQSTKISNQQFALQKSQDAAAKKLASVLAQRELNKITAIQQNIIKNKGQVFQKRLIDSKTRNLLNITSYRQNGNFVQRIYDTKTGEIRFNAFGSTKNGGKKSRARVTLGAVKTQRIPSEKLIRFDSKKVDANLKKVDAGFTSLDLSQRLKGIERISVFTSSQARNLIKKIERGGSLNRKDRAILLGLQFAIPVQQAIVGLKELPSFAKSLVKNPKNIIQVPGQILQGIKQSGVEIIALAKVDPFSAVARIGGEIFVIVASTKGIGVTGKVTGGVANKINPFLKRVKGGKLIVKTTAGKTTLRVGGSVKRISEPLSFQAKVAGKEVTAVSAQADRLVNFVRTKRLVRKPIPGEANLPKNVKRLLKKFDDGNINNRELLQLQSKVPVLERSFFADPKGRFRPSRLGIQTQKDASIIDIIKGDFTFKTSKPQIMVFENVKVAKFPVGLKDVEKALKSGKTLTKAQAKRLLDWQSEKTGKFKPIGALSKEPEITLAPGEVIKRVKNLGKTVIDGKKVEIVQVKVVKTSSVTKNLLNKAGTGKITAKELKRLTNNIKRETGFTPRLSKGKILKPRVRLPKRVPRVVRKVKKIKRVVRVVRKVKKIKRVVRKVKKIKRPVKVTRKGRVPKRIKRPIRKGKVPKRPAKRIARPSRTARSPRKTPPIIPFKLKQQFKKRTIPKKVPVYYIKIKKRGRIVNLSPKPLTIRDAKDLLVWSIDRNLIRTAYFEPIGMAKNVVRIPPQIAGYFAKNKRKVRPYKIRVGKKKMLRNGFIEKRRFALDTKREKAQIKKARARKKRTKKKK